MAKSESSNLERVTVNLIPPASRALETGMRITGYTKTDFINRAIQAYAFLEERISQDAAVLIREKDAGEQLKIFFT